MKIGPDEAAVSHCAVGSAVRSDCEKYDLIVPLNVC